jgi:hypothetical protein
MSPKNIPLVLWSLLAGAMLILGACAQNKTASDPDSVKLPTPTLNPIFNPGALAPIDGDIPATPSGGLLVPVNDSATPTQAPGSTEPVSAAAETINPDAPTPTSTPSPTETPAPSPTFTPTATEMFNRVMIFDEFTSDDWQIKYSQNMKYNDRDKTYPHNGTYDISVTPQADFGTLLFSLRQTAKEAYPRKDAAGVSFWLYSEEEIDPSALTVSVIGSNRFPFWYPDDKSVTNEQQPVFPETRLYYLDINRTIPPKTWVQIEVWLDDLLYEPEYEYITAIQIKNDAGFLNTFYLDQIELLMNPSTTQP